MQLKTKKRTHRKVSEEELAKIPRSMVIRAGSDTLKSSSISQLVKDMRNLMQPHTAINLRERKSNKIKDFVVMAGPLGVTQLMIFNQNENGSTHMRMASAPRGPTITFKVNTYSLNKDVRKFLKSPKSLGKESSEFLNPPLLVLNGFTNPKNAAPHEKVMITMFQNMFPPISPQETKVTSIRRVLMLNKDKETGEIDLRHYVIDTKIVDGSKNVKKLINAKANLHKRLPNLNKTKDVSDLILDPYTNPYTSESEVEDDAIVEIKNDEAEIVTRPKKTQAASAAAPAIADKKQTADVKKRAVKLTEVGPRLNLSLVKIEEGICDGKVLYHTYINKTEKEIKELEKKHKQKAKLREERKKEQAANVKAKKEKKEAKKLRRKERQEAKERGEEVQDSENESESEEEDQDMLDPEDFDPDQDLYSE